MPREIKVKLYSFEELLEAEERGEVNSRAVDRARDWLRWAITEGSWDEYIQDLWRSALGQIGFVNAEIRYSGFSCQGDGASFVSGIDVRALVDFMARDIPASTSITVDTSLPEGEDFRGWVVGKIDGKEAQPQYRRLLVAENWINAAVRPGYGGGNYVHEHTCEVSGEFQAPGRHERLERLFDRWLEDVENLRCRLSRAIYSSLENEYEGQTEDESLEEFAEANDFYFDGAGLYHRVK